MIDWLTPSLSQHPTWLLSFVDFLMIAILMCEVISLFCYAFPWLLMLSIFHVPIGHLYIFGGNVQFFCLYLIGHFGSFDIELILPVDRSWMVHIKEQVCATRPSCPVLSSSFWYGHPGGMTSSTFPFLVSFPESCVQVLFTIPCTIIVYSMYHY